MKRESYIDYLKIIASLMIVMLHVNISSLHLAGSLIDANHYKVAFVMHQLMYVAVPIFITLTGCGLLKSNKSTYKDLLPGIIKIALCIIIFGGIFESARIVLRHETIGPIDFIVDIYKGTTWSHMWYLNKILGLYLIIPVIKAFVSRGSRKNLCIFTLICFIFCSVIKTVISFYDVPKLEMFPIDGMFVFYAMAGYLIATADEKKLKKNAGLFMIGAILGVVLIVLYALSGEDIVILEDNPLQVLLSLNIVAIGRIALANRKENRFVTELSKITLWIYIVHPIFIHIVNSILGFNPQLQLPVISIAVTSIIIFALSAVVGMVIRKVVK